MEKYLLETTHRCLCLFTAWGTRLSLFVDLTCDKPCPSGRSAIQHHWKSVPASLNLVKLIIKDTENNTTKQSAGFADYSLSICFINVARELKANFRWLTYTSPDSHLHWPQSYANMRYFWFEKSVNELRVWLMGWGLDNMMTEGLYKHLLFKISSANANTPRQLSHFSCRWAILMQLLCTFSTTKLSVPFLLKMSELNRMTKLMNYCIFFLSAAQHLGGAISTLHAEELRGHGC